MASKAVRACLSRIKALYPSANVSALNMNDVTADLLLRASTTVLEEWLRSHGIETMDQDTINAYEKRMFDMGINLNICDADDYRAILANLIMVAVWHEGEETATALKNQLQVCADTHKEEGDGKG